MADYHAVLKRAIDALPESSGSARRAVYQRARAAIVNQLKNYDPPLSPSEITTEQLRLEEAIRKVEADAARVSLGLGPQPARKDSEPARAPAPQKPAGQPAPDVSVGAAASNGAPARPAPEVAADSKPDAAAMPRPNGFGAKTDTGNGTTATEKPADAAPGANGGAKPAKPAASPIAEPKTSAEAAPAGNGKAAMAEKQAPAGTAKQDKPAPPKDDKGPVARALAEAADTAPDTDYEEGIDIRPSRLPMIAAVIAAIIVFGALAVGVYSQREALLALLEPAPTQAPKTTSSDPATKPAEEDQASSKTMERLLKDDGSPAAPDALAVTTTRIVPPAEGEATPGETPVPPVREVTPPAPAGAPAEAPAAPETAITGLPAIPGAEAPAARGSGDLLVAQRAILYEEGDTSESTGSAAQGQVAWTTVQEAASGTSETDTVLKANITIPDRNISVAVSIRPNRDASLPASHLIEVQFTLPQEFAGKGIANVPGLIMKTTEEARGDALIGASVRVDSGFFWVALSSLDQERQRNVTLLRDRGWIDIPILYESGKRAILTLEKGDAGEKAVQAALDAWKQS